MKKYFKIFSSIVIICALLFGLDWSIGLLNKHLYNRSKFGIFHRQIYCLQESNDELVIFGSSRADHQYVSSIFADSLNLTTYNAGSEGMCIYYQYAILDSYIERQAIPKLVILDVQALDVLESNGATFTLEAALDRLAPHYGEYSGIDNMYNHLGWRGKLKMLSQTYKYNSKLVQTIKCNFIQEPEDRGYEAVEGRLPDNVIFNNSISQEGVIDHLKVEYFEKFIALCKDNNIPLLIVYSPLFYNSNGIAKNKIEELARKNEVKFWDFSNEPSLIKREYFRDVNHLHNEGAHIWSMYLAHEIKSKFIK